MPRKSHGGRRQGTPGTAYGNRSDLNMPISTVPNQEYGKATAQREAQQIVPMGSSPVAAAPAPRPMAQMQSAPPVKPGDIPYIAPTQRPNEPVTAGLPFGPGAGPSQTQPPALSQIFSMGSQGLGATSLMNSMANAARALGI